MVLSAEKLVNCPLSWRTSQANPPQDLTDSTVCTPVPEPRDFCCWDPAVLSPAVDSHLLCWPPEVTVSLECEKLKWWGINIIKLQTYRKMRSGFTQGGETCEVMEGGGGWWLLPSSLQITFLAMFFHILFTWCEMDLSQLLQVILAAILMLKWHQNSLVPSTSMHIPQ